MSSSIPAPDEDARRGLRLALTALAALPLTVFMVAVAPHGVRAGLFLLGLAVAAVISIAGGILARRALSAGTALRAHAVTGAMLGLWVGVTAAVVWFWALVGIVL